VCVCVCVCVCVYTASTAFCLKVDRLEKSDGYSLNAAVCTMGLSWDLVRDHV
jgi:hypothetical protein